MADPVKKTTTWSRSYPTYAEKHEMYRVFQELLKELIIMKPSDPLAYIRDEISNVAQQLYAPRVFLLGPNPFAQRLGRDMARTTGSCYLTLEEVAESTPESVRDIITAYIKSQTDEEGFDDNLRKLLCTSIMQRLRNADCQKNGYILHGFPQNKAQAISGQQMGLLPRQVYILLPDPGTKSSNVGVSSSEAPSKSNTASGNTGDSGKSAGLGVASSQIPRVPSSTTKTEEVAGESNGASNEASSKASLPAGDYHKIKEIADCYDYEICKTVPYEKWHPTSNEDVESELLHSLSSVRPCGSPWIPRILLVGPPYAGKSAAAEQLAMKYGLVNVDFIECVRGAARLKDEVGKACQKYLQDLIPLADAVTRTLLQRRLLRPDCERKGWILHGFPDTVRQLSLLYKLEVAPNRVFYMACPEDICWTRLQIKRQEVLDRKMPAAKGKNLVNMDEMNFEDFPYGKQVFRTRTDTFHDSLDALVKHYGKDLIFVDAAQQLSTVLQFMDMAVLRPPVIRFQDY